MVLFPICHTRSCISFPLLRISHLCVFCDILSPKAVYRVLCPFFRPKMFSPGDRVWYNSRTLGAYVLATVVGPSPSGPQFCHIRYIRPGGVNQVDHESAQLSRIEAVLHHPSCCTCVLFACISGVASVCLEIAFPPWGGDRQLAIAPPPPPMGGDHRTLRREFSKGGVTNDMGRCDTLPGGSGSPSVTHEWLAAFLDTVHFVL